MSGNARYLYEILVTEPSHVLSFSQISPKKSNFINFFIQGQTSAFVLESSIPNHENESLEVYDNGHFVGMQTQNVKYDLPQSSNYDYSEPSYSTHYEYPSVSNPKLNTSDNSRLGTNANVMDREYASLNFTQLDMNDNDSARYQSLIHVHKGNSKTSQEEVKRETKELPYVEVLDGEYSSLVWSKSSNYEDEPSQYQSLIKIKYEDDKDK